MHWNNVIPFRSKVSPNLNDHSKEHLTYPLNSPPQLGGVASSTYPIGQYRGARLLSASGDRARVNDAVFFMSNNVQNKVNLNLCVNGAYNGGFYSPQQRNGPFRPGNSALFFVTCGNTDSYSGGTQLNTAAEWTKRSDPANTATYNNPNVVGALPGNADDCARLCNWITLEFVSTTDANYNTQCISWEWVGAAFDNGRCDMFTSRPDLVGNSVPKAAPKSGIFAAGVRVQNVFQTTGVTSWKRSINGGEFAGRYKRDLWIEERSEDWMRPDVVLRAADFPI